MFFYLRVKHLFYFIIIDLQSFDFLFTEPNVPSGLSADDASATSFDLSWSHSGAVDDFKVYFKTGSGAEKNAFTSSTATQYILGSVGLTAATMYDIHVVALVSGTESERSDPLSAGTGEYYL